uniref:MYND-type domain-containing protein n=1 Tax=Tetradesmus obliquus TaxID=3088 RepID=A0A383V964_TETOB|eukprot:jgi/Sobl393_1/14272/SZX61490.1
MSTGRDAAEAFNKAANEAYKQGDFRKAVDCFTLAISAYPSRAKRYLTNRANVHIRLGDPHSALLDAEASLQRDDKWIKGYYYKGVALEALGRLLDAKQVLLVGLALDPGGVHALDLQDAIYRCGAAIDEAVAKGTLQPEDGPENAEMRYQAAMRQVMAQVRRQSQAAAAASKARDNSIKQLLRYRGVPGARPFVKARLLREDGHNALAEGDTERGVVKLAEGYLVQAEAMGRPTNRTVQLLVTRLDAFSRTQPQHPAAPLVLAFLRAPCQSGAWLAQQLRGLEGRVPDGWRPGLLRELAGICIRDDVADYEGAYQAAVQGLAIKPRNADLLFYKAWAYKLMGNRRLGSEECPALGSPGFCVWVQKRIDDTAAVNKLFQDFIDAAPPQHPKVPSAYYYMAERVLVNRIISRVPMSRCIPGDAAVAEETMRLYDAGMAAEKELPPFYLPIVCASRESTPIFLEAHMPGYLASRSSRHRVPSKGSADGSSDGSSSSSSPSKSGIGSCVRRSAEELQVRKSLLKPNSPSSHLGDSNSSSSSSSSPVACSHKDGSSSQGTGSCRKGRVAAAVAAAAAGVHSCSRCSVQASNMKQCSGCSARYCCIDCQMADWHAGHKKSCERSFLGRWLHKFF